jgi:serine/threonine protein kinase
MRASTLVYCEWRTSMATGLSRDECLQNLIDSGLFSKEEIDGAPPAADGEALAQHLVDAGKLTAFQAAAVLERQFERLVVGNYQVLDRLGAGGMGTVYKARHRRMNRVVAIKVLSREIAQSPSLVKRFQREVEAVARLSHPNIVMAHDADEAEAGHFLVMEFVNGRDLAVEVEQHGPLPIRTAVECILQAARALEYAHGQGVIHRDIKPANLLRDVSGLVKVADLGLARFNDQIDETAKQKSALTQAGTIMGTVDFMSPEQAMGQSNLDHRTDIYSLGCTLHFLLLGRPPYEGPSMMAVLLNHRQGPIPSLTAERPEVPAPLDAVFRRMVAKAAADRFQTMTQVVAALESILANLGEPAATPPGATAGAPTTAVGGGNWQKTRPADAPAPMAQTIEQIHPETREESLLKVMLVEPSRTQSAIIRKYLQDQGVQRITAAASGQEALRLLQSDPPDAIVSALHLPDMTGVQLAQLVRAESKEPGPGFVLISSEGASSEASGLSNCDKAVVLQKPFTPEQLVGALRLVTHAPSTATIERGNVRVLIVDDSVAARKHIQSVLTSLGLSQFVLAGDGAQAVAAVAGASFDLIVTDYNMPYMDGLGLVGYLRQNAATASVPIIMVTTEQDAGKLEAVRQMGVAVCDKSFPPEVARTIIDQLVKLP